VTLDRNIVRWLNHASQNQPLRALAILAAKYLAVVPPLLLIGVFLWAFSRRDTRTMATAGLAGLGAALALGANQLVGQIVTRSRPYSVLVSVHAIGSRNGDSSFYSDHTTVAVGTAIGEYLVARRLGVVALAVAALVGLGRIAVGAHYPSDVLAGAVAAAIGVALLLLLAGPVRRLLEICLRLRNEGFPGSLRLLNPPASWDETATAPRGQRRRPIGDANPSTEAADGRPPPGPGPRVCPM